MTTFQPIILQCPLCKQKMHCYELSSYTIYRSTVFSDSKTITEPYVDNERAIRICPSCNQAVWVEDATINIENPYEVIENVPKALDVHDLPFNMTDNVQQNRIKFYTNLLEQGFAYSNEKKYYLRIRLWWAINDLIRYRTSFIGLVKEVFHLKALLRYYKSYLDGFRLFKSFSDLFKDNLSQLIILNKPLSDDDYFMLAEMHRELGKFKKAGITMSKVNFEDSSAVKKLKKRILFRQKTVFKL